MASVYAASALLLLSLPHSFAVPVNQDLPIVPDLDPVDLPAPPLDTSAPVVPVVAPIVSNVPVETDPIVLSDPVPAGPDPVNVSPLTGGALTSPDFSEEPFPVDPGVENEFGPEIPWLQLPSPLPFPIAPDSGDDTGPEASGDPVSSILPLASDVVGSIEITLSDPVPSEIDVPVATAAVESTTPEIIKDPLLLPPDQQTADSAIVPPQTLSVNSFLSIVQQLANVISGFFTIQPGQPAPPIPIVPSDIAEAIASAATAIPPVPAPNPLGPVPIPPGPVPIPPVPLPIPFFPPFPPSIPAADLLRATHKLQNLQRRAISTEQRELLVEIAAKNAEIQRSMAALRKFYAQKNIEKRDNAETAADYAKLNSLFSDMLALIDKIEDLNADTKSDGEPLAARSESLDVGGFLSNFGGLGGPPTVAKPIASSSPSLSDPVPAATALDIPAIQLPVPLIDTISPALDAAGPVNTPVTGVVNSLKPGLVGAQPIVDGTKPVHEIIVPITESLTPGLNTAKPVTDTIVSSLPLKLIQDILIVVQKLLPLASPAKTPMLTSRSELPVPGAFESIYKTLEQIVPPAEAAKALQAAFDALSPASQAAVLLLLTPGPVIPDHELIKTKQIEKRETPGWVIANIKDFIKKWHTVGVSLGDYDPALVAGLMKVFKDPTIDPSYFPTLGKYPESIRQFVLEYYGLAQVLIDSGVSTEDKVDLLHILFDGSPRATRKRDVAPRDDGAPWDEKKVKDFIKLFWKLDPKITDLSQDLNDQLFGPFKGGYPSAGSYGGDVQHVKGEIQKAAVLWATFRELLASLNPEDARALVKVIQSGQLPEPNTYKKRSMRRGLRHRQTKYTQPDFGVELDDAQKLGAKLTKILGPSGSLDPMGMNDADILHWGKEQPYPIATTPFYDTSSNHLKPNPQEGWSDYDPTSNDYVGDYDDADDAAADFWDPYSQIDAHADEYAGVAAGAPQNW